MRCIHPFVRRYLDAITHEEHFIECPCGKCIACLRNQQDSWAIRITETAKRAGAFIYDTLTFNPKSLPMEDVTDQIRDPNRVWSAASDSLLHHYSKKVNGETRYFVPKVERSIIRDWIRRGRELYCYDHRDAIASGKMSRPKWKYTVFMEYGPKTSRPHFHLLFFGISKTDYDKYLGDPWFYRFGFHYATTVDPRFPFKHKKTKQQFEHGKSVDCIARYISKYCSKGVFESPLVKDYFCPKPFRSISNGIGEEYLSNDFFKYFHGIMPQFWLSLEVDKKKNPLGDYDLFMYEEKSRWHLNDLMNDVDILEGFRAPSDFVLSRLSVYYDSLGCPHALPRYYKQKLLKLHRPNLLSYAIQTLLLENSQLYLHTRLAEFARSLGLRVSGAKEKLATLGLSRRVFDMVSQRFAAWQSSEARACAKRRKIELSNFYKRPITDPAFAWVS